MGHSLQAFLIPAAGWRRENAGVAPVHPVKIGANLVLLPLTDELFDFVVAGDQSPNEYEGIFWKYHPAMRELGAALAGTEAFGYIETEYFGGRGAQAAGAWRALDTLVAPRQAKIGPINDVLRALGVVATRGADEFATVGLDRHRHMEDWLGEPTFGDPLESPQPVRSRSIRRISFDRPSTPLSSVLLDAIGQVLAGVTAIEEAYLDRCSIDGEAAEDALVLGIRDDAPIPGVMDDLLPRLRLLVAPAEHLDVLPFRVSDLPRDARILEGRIHVRARKVRPWWKLW